MKILPLKTVFNGELTSLKIKVNSFDIEDSTCNFTWIFYNIDGLEIKSGNYILTEEEYTNWGSENNYLFNVFAIHFEETYGQKLELIEDIQTKDDVNVAFQE